MSLEISDSGKSFSGADLNQQKTSSEISLAKLIKGKRAARTGDSSTIFFGNEMKNQMWVFPFHFLQ